LAHLLQAVALTFAATIAQGADFSHRAHLAMGFQCTACHVSVTTSTRAEDNNLPPRAVCLGCHQDVAIKSPRPTALARFNHEKHVTAITCLQCHRGMDQSEVTSAANFPPMASCIVCHNQVDIPVSCAFCHAQTMKLLPANHVVDFIDTHSRVKHSAPEKQACEICHGRNFHCAGCH
jgi:hypothetical protein